MLRLRKPASLLVIALATAAFAAHAQGGNCGNVYVPEQYGPYDYRTQREHLVVVDKFHFNPQVEALIRGQSSYIGGDLNYVLKAAPNHHRALLAATRLAEKTKPAVPEGMEFPIECYYERAITFAANDIVVRALYAQFLNRRGRRDEGIKQLRTAAAFAKDDGFAHYNIGLVYLELHDYDAALEECWRAQALGFERQELAAMLKRANKWREPPPELAASTAATAAAASAAD